VLDEAVATGIEWIRIDFVWSLVEERQDVFDWDRYDRLMNNAEERGLKVFASLQGTPQWATWGLEFSGVPHESDDWRDFCYRAAARYREQVAAWGIWNEPNLDRFWQGTRTEFIEMILIPGAEAIRAAHPEATIAAADLAHISSGDWEDWLKSIIRIAGHLIDVITHHSYPSDADHNTVTDDLHDGHAWPWDPPPVREVLIDEGWSRRPFWLSETGVQSDHDGLYSQANFYADILNDWYGEVRRTRWVDRIFFYEMVDHKAAPWLSWGIVGSPPELHRKPVFYAYREFIESAEVDDAEITSIEIPRFVGTGGSQLLLITLRNTGTTSWTDDDGVRLVAEVDSPYVSLEGGRLADDLVVHPGDSVTIEVDLDTSDFVADVVSLQTYFFARMGRPDRWYFGDAVYRAITITSLSPPEIDLHPLPMGVPRKGSAAFSVAAIGDGALQYQWQRNSISLSDDGRISGASTPDLRISDVSFDLVGDYACVVTNDVGSVVSKPAALDIVAGARRSSRRVRSGTATLKAWQEFQSRPERDRSQSVIR
jgi:hypothetical protein